MVPRVGPAPLSSRAMAARLKNFDQMWDAYPAPGGSADEVRRIIGGRVEAMPPGNTCVIRVSRAFNESGNAIPSRSNDELLTVEGGDGKEYALRVRELTRYLERKYGPADLEQRYPEPGGGEIPESFKGRQGVIVFEVEGWSDATGHADLWNGSTCRHNCYFAKASRVMLWEVDETPRPMLGASVGKGGSNDRIDVEWVQKLLAENGVSPGEIDGLSGPKTVAAIREFQARFMTTPDGRVDVDGRTWRELLGQ